MTEKPTLTTTELPVDIRVNNIQNGFAISDNLSGSVPRTSDGGTNLCQITAINSSTSSTTVFIVLTTVSPVSGLISFPRV